MKCIYSRPPCCRSLIAVMVVGLVASISATVLAQAMGKPDRASPGDEMIQKYLEKETMKVEGRFAEDLTTREAYEKNRARYGEEYFYMLGLSPMPEKTPLKPTVTGKIEGDGYVVEMMHYQSRPGLYVTGNLYRPAAVRPGEKLPAVFYVCGHSNRGRNGNKTAYQSHGIWFARHGYICLAVDSLQLGEIGATHHGTYRYERWWWHSRGYTPAGVECWNGMRGIDYLQSRPDVDPQRIAVTGISGGGAATFWISAADERVKASVPVSGMADLESYIPNRVINGHCDCMFLYNTFQWPWTRIAGLVAPRPLLFVNSDKDGIFPMDANERVINRLKRLYSLSGNSDRVECVVSVGGHAYRQDIRQAAYRFINSRLKGDAREVADSEVDIVSEGNKPGSHPIAPEKLRVFPTDEDLPKDQLNTTIDERFVPVAKVAAPEAGKFDAWKSALVAELRRVTFNYFPAAIPAAKKVKDIDPATEAVQSEEEIEFRLRYAEKAPKNPASVLLVVLNQDEAGTTPAWVSEVAGADQAVVLCEPRGIGATKWTTKNPPNYVERSHALLGRTADTGRVWDVIAAAKYLATADRLGAKGKIAVSVAGCKAAGVIGAYAAALEEQIAGATLVSPPVSHDLNSGAPALMNVLRVCDVPDALGLIAPRPLNVRGVEGAALGKTAEIYRAAGAGEKVTIK